MTEKELNYEMLRAAIGVSHHEDGTRFFLGRWLGDQMGFSPDGHHVHLFPESWAHVKPPQGTQEFNFAVFRNALTGAHALTKGKTANGTGRSVFREFNTTSGNSVWVSERILKEYKQFCYAASQGLPISPVFIYESPTGRLEDAKLSGFILPVRRQKGGA